MPAVAMKLPAVSLASMPDRSTTPENSCAPEARASVRGGVVRVDHVASVVAVRGLALAAELDLGGDVALALEGRVRGGDARREPRAGGLGGREEGGDAGEIVDAHVAARRALEDTWAAVGVGRVVLRLARAVRLEGRAGGRATLVPEVQVVAGLVLEVPRAVVEEVLHLTVPLPVDRVETARDGVPVHGDVLVPILLEPAAGRLSDVRREAVDLAVREAVAAEEVGGNRTLGVAPLDADVDARRDDVLREDVVGAVGALPDGVLAGRLRRPVHAEVAVVAAGREADVVRVAAVELHDLLEAAEGEGARGVRRARRHIDDVRREAGVATAGLVAGPLLVGDEERVFDAERAAPLVPLLEVGRAERLHEPVGALDHARVHDGRPAVVAAVLVRVRVVRVGGAAGGGALVDNVALQVVDVLDRVAGVLDHVRGGLAVGHELGELLAVIVDVHDVRAGESGLVGADKPR